MPLATGTRLGPYEILGAIGAGGMGDVYRARDTRLDRTVAIKTLRGSFSDRFEREARAISALNHPHICTLHDIGDHEGTAYLVMEYVEGRALAGPLPINEALKYATEICGALEAAHKKGIIHRDLKPANILVTKGGVKLLDFGLARIERRGGTDSDQTSTDAELTKLLTGAHVILGTPQYMAPEQIEGREADARSDIFAFGCVLYELLTGQKAFDGKSASSVMAAILATEPRPMSSLQPLTPPALERIVTRCLAKDPDDRWQTARDLRAEIEWIASAPDRASPVGSAAAGGARSRLPWTVAAVFALTMAGSVALWWRQPPETDRRSLAMEVSPPSGFVFDSYPLVSPNGRQVAFIARDQNGKPTAFVRRLDFTSSQALTSVVGARIELSGWSRDSREIAFYSGTQLRRVNVETGNVQTICDCGRGSPVVSWNDDGVILLSSSIGPLLRVSAAGGEPTPVTALNAEREEYVHQNPSFLRDGRHFIYAARSRRPEADAILTGSLDVPPGPTAPFLLSPSTALFAGGSPDTNFLLFSRNGALMAQTLDMREIKLTGDPIQVSPKVGFTGATTINASASDEGTVAYSTEFLGGPAALKRFAWFDRSGQLIAEVGRAAPFREFAMASDEKRVAVTRLGNPNVDIWLMDLEHDGALSALTTDPTVEAYPTWSRDGTSLFFARGQTDDAVIWRKSLSAQRVESVVAGAKGRALDVSPDGRSLLYSSWTRCGR